MREGDKENKTETDRQTDRIPGIVNYLVPYKVVNIYVPYLLSKTIDMIKICCQVFQ